MADPKHNICEYRPNDKLHATTTIEIGIRHIDPDLLTRTVAISVMGIRYNERDRSASPRRDKDGRGVRDRSASLSEQRLPKGVSIYAIPTRKGPKTFWNAKIQDGSDVVEGLLNNALNNTGYRPEHLAYVNMHSGIPEHIVSPI
jgi:hypothetical protein